MNFLVEFQKRFNGSKAYVILYNYPTENRGEAAMWLLKNKVGKAFLSDNYEYNNIRAYHKSVTEINNSVICEIDYELAQRKKKLISQQQKLWSTTDESSIY